MVRVERLRAEEKMGGTSLRIYLLTIVNSAVMMVSGAIVFDSEGYSDHHNFGYLYQKT